MPVPEDPHKATFDELDRREAGLAERLAALEETMRAVQSELEEVSGTRASLERLLGRVSPPRGPYAGMGVKEATLLCLDALDKPSATREISDALLAGGLTTTADDPYATVYATLDRLRKTGAIFKNGPLWGLPKFLERAAANGPSALSQELDAIVAIARREALDSGC